MSQSFAMITQAHDDALAAMTPAAAALYRWIMRTKKVGTVIEINLKEFVAIYKRGTRRKSYTLRHVQRQLRELIAQGLVDVTHKFNGYQFKLAVLHPKEYLRRRDENRQKRSQLGTERSQYGTKKSQIQPSNPRHYVPLNIENKEQQTGDAVVPLKTLEEGNGKEQEGGLRGMVASDEVQLSQAGMQPVEEGEDDWLEAWKVKETILPPAPTISEKVLSDDDWVDSTTPDEAVLPPAPPAISEKVLSELKSAIGYKISDHVMDKLLQFDEDAIRKAIACTLQGKKKGQINNPTAYFLTALQRGYEPAPSVETPVRSAFSEWYDKARAADFVAASTVSNGVQYVCTNAARGIWLTWEDAALMRPFRSR